MSKPVALITGVGPGTGASMARRFAAGGYRVAMLARDAKRLDELQREIPDSRAYVCDVADEKQIDATVKAVEADLGAPSVFIHNAVGGAFGNFLTIEPEVLNRNFQINTMGLLHFARRLAPAMIAAGKGVILATGNTSAQRGKALRAEQGGPAHPGRVDRARPRAQGHPRGLPAHRRGDRREVGARDVRRQARRVLHPAGGDRRRGLARSAPGAFRLVVQRRSAALRRELVSTMSTQPKRETP